MDWEAHALDFIKLWLPSCHNHLTPQLHKYTAIIEDYYGGFK